MITIKFSDRRGVAEACKAAESADAILVYDNGCIGSSDDMAVIFMMQNRGWKVGTVRKNDEGGYKIIFVKDGD